MSLFCIRKKSGIRRSPRKAAGTLANTDNSFFMSNAQHTLQVQAPKANVCPDRSDREGTSLFTLDRRVKASLTVEAALAMSIFLFAVLGMLGFFFVMRTQIQVQSALEQTGNQLAGLPEMASIPAATVIFQEKMALGHVDDSAIIGGQTGVSLGLSSVMGHESVIDLVAVYRIKIPFFPDGTAELRIVQRSRKQAFGESVYLSSSKTKYVYVTLQGEVYHEDMYCTYIRPKTEKLSVSEVTDRRNGDGSIYYACRFCCEDMVGAEVWITKWGEAYHQSEYCRGIWHNVERIPMEEAWGKRACSKCSRQSVGQWGMKNGNRCGDYAVYQRSGGFTEKGNINMVSADGVRFGHCCPRLGRLSYVAGGLGGSGDRPVIFVHGSGESWTDRCGRRIDPDRLRDLSWLEASVGDASVRNAYLSGRWGHRDVVKAMVREKTDGVCTLYLDRIYNAMFLEGIVCTQ